jgi:hypothetical protein
MTGPHQRSTASKAISGPDLGLRAIAKLRAIDRRLQTVVLARFFGRWAAIPAFILMAGCLGYMLLIRGAEAASALLLPIVGFMVVVTIFWSAADRLRAEEEQLRRERREVASGAASGAPFRLQRPE